jgi:hypothetical protein
MRLKSVRSHATDIAVLTRVRGSHAKVMEV